MRWQTLDLEMFIQRMGFITANCPEKVQVSWGRIIGFYLVFVCIPNCAFKLPFGFLVRFRPLSELSPPALPRKHKKKPSGTQLGY